MKRILFLMIFLVIFIAGCISTPEQIAKAAGLSKGFMEEYPNAEIVAVKVDSNSMEALLPELQEKCGDAIQLKDYYKVTITDESTDLNVVVWVDLETSEVVCAIKSGVKYSVSEPSEEISIEEIEAGIEEETGGETEEVPPPIGQPNTGDVKIISHSVATDGSVSLTIYNGFTRDINLVSVYINGKKALGLEQEDIDKGATKILTIYSENKQGLFMKQTATGLPETNEGDPYQINLNLELYTTNISTTKNKTFTLTGKTILPSVPEPEPPKVKLSDVTIPETDFEFSSSSPSAGDDVTIKFIIKNVGEGTATDVIWSVDDLTTNEAIKENGDSPISSIKAGSSVPISVLWKEVEVGSHEIQVKIKVLIGKESHTDNNIVSQIINVS